MRRLIICVVFFLGMSFLAQSCVSLRSVSLTSIPKQRSRTVTASVNRTIFLGFNFDNDYVDNLVDQLKSQCQGGIVTGILTKDEVTSYFIAHNRKVTARGYCVKS